MKNYFFNLIQPPSLLHNQKDVAFAGSGCSTVVKYKPSDREVMGSNPGR